MRVATCLVRPVGVVGNVAATLGTTDALSCSFGGGALSSSLFDDLGWHQFYFELAIRVHPLAVGQPHATIADAVLGDCASIDVERFVEFPQQVVNILANILTLGANNDIVGKVLGEIVGVGKDLGNTNCGGGGIFFVALRRATHLERYVCHFSQTLTLNIRLFKRTFFDNRVKISTAARPMSSVVVVKPGLGVLDRLFSERVVMPTLWAWFARGYTPNMLTTLGNWCGFNCLLLWHYYSATWLAIVCLWARFYFDCADGLFARRYMMTSDFGDWYDHISDWTFGVGFSLVIFAKYSGMAFWLASAIFLASTLLLAAQLAGVEESNKGNWEHNYMLAMTVPWFPFDKKYIQFADGVFYYTVQTLIIGYSV